jgi:hypothetical protein
MKKVILILVIGLGLALILMAGGAFAADTTDSKNLTINATVSATAKLILSPLTIAFPNADPDDMPTITSPDVVTVTAKAKTSKGSTVTLQVLANGDLTESGHSATIPISNVKWEATTGAGFVSGTMNKTAAQTAGSWSDSGDRPGTFTYKLTNSWSYSTGNYTQTATYTLSAP